MNWQTALILTAIAAFVAWVIPYETEGMNNHANDMEVLSRWLILVVFAAVTWGIVGLTWLVRFIGDLMR